MTEQKGAPRQRQRARQRAFTQVDVFAERPLVGNPLAVVLDSQGIDTETMQTFARWTNLSETTFLLPPTSPEADYSVRIFTPYAELPFAGHPTLGSCHAWLENGGKPKNPDLIIQECGAGLVKIRRTTSDADGIVRLAFAEPPLIRSGDVTEELKQHLADLLNLKLEDIVDAQWGDNGPGWVICLLKSKEAVLSVKPAGTVDLDIGIVAPCPESDKEASFEVRAFFPQDGVTLEDPVTGSLNASIAGWLIRSGRAPDKYVARQGTAMKREGKIWVERDAEGVIWIGGATQTLVRGTVDL